MIRLPIVLLLALALAGLAGCAKSVKPGKPPQPLSPETQITYAPLQGDTASFRVHFYWSGWDKDGEVVRFRWAVDADTIKDEHDWHSTTSKDTTLLFLVDPVKEIQGHVFWVAAEDNDGHIDSTPAKRFFSAKTIPPTSKIDRGPDGKGLPIGPNFTFEWSGIDPDGGETGGSAPVDSFEYLLLQVRGIADTNTPPTHDPLPDFDEKVYLGLINEATGRTLLDRPAPGRHSDWAWQGVRGTRKRFRNVTPAPYVFAVRAVDIAGATEKNLKITDNIRYFNVTNRNPGPLLTICSSVLNKCLPAASGPEDIVRKQIQVFEGETVSFSWTASAEFYGGEVVGYTFAMDDTTTAEWGSLTLLKTGATFSRNDLPPGAHNLYVRVVDDGGLVTNAKIPLLIVHPDFKDPGAEKNALYVDDFGTPGATPLNAGANYLSDDAEDIWWADHITTPLTQEFGVPFTQYDTVRNNIGIEGRGVPDPSELKKYRVVIWSVDLNNTGSSPTGLWKTLVGGDYSQLAGYLRAGGTLILTGFQLMNNTTSPSTTAYSFYSRGMCLSVPQGTTAYDLSYFPRTIMGVDGALAGNQGLRTNGAHDFVEARVTTEGAARGYQTAQVDTGRTAKWNPYAFTGPPNSALSPGMGAVDGWNMQTFFGCIGTQTLFRREDANTPIAVPILRYHGVPQGIAMDGLPSPREGLVVGIATQAHDLGNQNGGVVDAQNSQNAFGRMVFLGFPIYYLKDPQAYQIMRTAFAYVNSSPTLPQ
ncbi:MAG TPA: hypothetical protein VF363_10375 [Candidatus Eisenbacteria bacterium]